MALVEASVARHSHGGGEFAELFAVYDDVNLRLSEVGIRNTTLNPLNVRVVVSLPGGSVLTVMTTATPGDTLYSVPGNRSVEIVSTPEGPLVVLPVEVTMTSWRQDG